MDITYASTLLGILIDNANRISQAGFGLNELEHVYFEVIRLIREQPELKPEVLSKLESSANCRNFGQMPGGVQQELAELIAHEFRWPEIEEMISTRRIERQFHGRADLAVGDIATSILDAMSDGWADREFYRRYTKATP